MNKKIVYLRTDLGARDLTAGGSVSHTLGVMRGFIQLSYDIFCASSVMINTIQIMPITQFVDLRMPRIFSFLGHKINALFSTFFFAIYAAKLCRNKEIAFIYQRYSILNATGVLLSWWYKKKLILEFNSSSVWAEEHWTPQKRIKLRFLVRWIELLNVRYAHQIVAVSKPIKDTLVTQGVKAEKILVNPNGVDIDVYNSKNLALQRQQIRASLNIEDKFVFGFIGTFSYWHGIDTLIAMIPRIVALYDNVHFLLIGSGQLYYTSKIAIDKIDIAAQATTFTGRITPEEARTYLAACDAFLSPTKPNSDGTPFFGSPTKLFEYMSLGKPIIASNLDQLAEIIQPAIYMPVHGEQNEIKQGEVESIGILVQPDDVTGFVKAACWLLEQDITVQQRLGHTARSKVCAHYTWVQHVKNIINFSA